MGMEDRVAGKIKQAKGKGQRFAGAAKGNTGQQIKGKVTEGRRQGHRTSSERSPISTGRKSKRTRTGVLTAVARLRFPI